MGQAEVLRWLLDKRLLGDDSFFSKPDIVKAFGNNNNVRKNINRLRCSGFLDVEFLDLWKCGYRIKDKYVIESKDIVNNVSDVDDFRVSDSYSYTNIRHINTQGAKKVLGKERLL